MTGSRSLFVTGVLWSLAVLCPGERARAQTIDTHSNQVGRLTSVGNGSVRRFFEYDRVGRAARTEYVLEGRSFVFENRFGYPQNSVATAGLGSILVSTTFPDGERVDYGYDASGGQQTVRTTPPGGSQQGVVVGVRRNARGQIVQNLYGNGLTVTNCYHPATFRLERRVAATHCLFPPGAALQDYTYTYDDVGNVTAIADNSLGAPASFSATYGYDTLDQLTSRTSEAVTRHYVYDGAGNLTGKDVASSSDQNQTYGGAGQRGPHAVATAQTASGTLSYAYDFNGNLTSATDGLSISWNAEDMAVSVARGGTTLAKSYLGSELWKKVDASGTTFYLPALRWEDGRLRKFFGAFAERSAEDGQLRFYLPDHLGSSTLVTNLGATVEHRSGYLPYGGDNGAAGGAFLPRYRFAFKEKDRGLYDLGARLYDPEIGRFISADSRISDGPNRYTYALNNPLRLVDPSGHGAEGPQGLWVGQWNSDGGYWAFTWRPFERDSSGKVIGSSQICDQCQVFADHTLFKNANSGRVGELLPGGQIRYRVESSWSLPFRPGDGPSASGSFVIGALTFAHYFDSSDRNAFYREMATEKHPWATAAGDFAGNLLAGGVAGGAAGRSLTSGPSTFLGRLSVPRIHANSLSSPKPAWGYTLVDKTSGEPVKYGMTTNVRGRYPWKFLRDNNLGMVIENSGSVRQMRSWENAQILDYFTSTGRLPPFNFNLH